MPFRILFSLFLMFLLVCCEQKNGTEEIVVPPVTPADTTDTPNDSTILSVSQAQSLLSAQPAGPVSVKGFIVGTLDGTTIRNGHFTAPFATTSNLVIAASIDNTGTTELFPIQLKANSTLRQNLNLKGHPEYLHKQIVFKGYLTTYFSSCGMKDILSYKFLNNSADSTTHANDSTSLSVPVNNGNENIQGGR